MWFLARCALEAVEDPVAPLEDARVELPEELPELAPVVCAMLVDDPRARPDAPGVLAAFDKMLDRISPARLDGCPNAAQLVQLQLQPELCLLPRSLVYC